MKIDHLPTSMSAGFTVEQIYAIYKSEAEYYPAGQLTDGGSIIFLLAWLVKRYGRHLTAFICHDIDYRYKRYSKWSCDMRMLWRMRNGSGYEAMSLGEQKLAGKWKRAGFITIIVTFLYLNTFGWLAWLNHRIADRKYKGCTPKADRSGFMPVLLMEGGKHMLQSFDGHRTMTHTRKEMACKEWATVVMI